MYSQIPYLWRVFHIFIYIYSFCRKLQVRQAFIYEINIYVFKHDVKTYKHVIVEAAGSPGFIYTLKI